jgi:3alpha(or 20beta)-hydroxysteroid dehydrogenase
MDRVDGRGAIVAGEARGMAAARGRALVREGADVLVTNVLEDEGRQAAEEPEGCAWFPALCAAAMIASG